MSGNGSPRIDLVVTTIFEPNWLDGYLADLREFGRVEDVTFRVIGDRKTPSSVWAAADRARAEGFSVVCPTLDEQTSYLARLGLADDFIPWNTDNRRNIGFLQAWESGADVVVSIDDDNYCKPGSNFFGSHLVVGHDPTDLDDKAGVTDGPWFNICTMLDTGGGATVYPRGFPYAARGTETPAGTGGFDGPGPIAVNAGLWIRDPDVDAVTRLSLRPLATTAEPGAVVMGARTWSPINTQNTAIVRDALPAYYYVRMGFRLQGMTIDRYGDILSGYFLQKCVKHLGQLVRVGSPVADHIRTPHNLFIDLYHELAGMVLIEDLVPWLSEVHLSGSTYEEAYASLAEALRDEADRFRGFVWDEGGREFLRETAECMLTWLRTLQRLAG